MKIRTSIAATLFALAGLGMTGTVHANPRIDEDAANLDRAGISLTEAIAVAERHHQGSRAFQADFEYNRGQSHFDVDVVTPDRQVYDVRIDARDGKVLDSRLDNDD